MVAAKKQWFFHIVKKLLRNLSEIKFGLPLVSQT
jgi:hypothetical protein